MIEALRKFARLVGIADRHAEDALHSERAAQAVLNRRDFFAVGGALAAATAFSFPAPRALTVTLRERVHSPFYDTLIRQAGYGDITRLARPILLPPRQAVLLRGDLDAQSVFSLGAPIEKLSGG